MHSTAMGPLSPQNTYGLVALPRAWAFGGEDKAFEESRKAHLGQGGLALWNTPGSQCFSVAHSWVCVS